MSGKNAVRVAVPVKLARLRVWVDKGRHWSGVDRLILWALAVEPCTSSELAKVARILARLITEIILRMMRFGWVEDVLRITRAIFCLPPRPMSQHL